MGKQSNKRERIKKKIRAKITGTAKRPRLAVFRSNRYIYTQLIDDTKGQTIASASDLKSKGRALVRAVGVGEALARAAAEKKIKEAVFDRGGFRYAGRIKALAESVRKAGLKI